MFASMIQNLAPAVPQSGFAIPNNAGVGMSPGFSIGAIPAPSMSSNPNHIGGGSGTQVTAGYLVSYADPDRRLLRQGQLLFIASEIMADTSPNRGQYKIKNLESLNRLLSNKYDKAMRTFEISPDPGLVALRDVPERMWYDHPVFKGILPGQDRMDVRDYLTKTGIMNIWNFLGVFLMDEGLNKSSGGVMVNENMFLPALLQGSTDVEDVWGKAAVPGAELFFILKRKMVDGNTRNAGPFQFVPYVKDGKSVVIPDSDLIYYDSSGTKQYGVQIYVGRVMDEPDKQHTTDSIRLVESGLMKPSHGAAVDQYARVKRLHVYFPPGDKLWKTREDWFF